MSLFVTSDQHFGHTKSLSFLQPDGSFLRPFSSIEEADQTMVDRWNAVVQAKDTVYCLGDVAIPKSGLRNLERLNGRKILVRGNHDCYALKDYAKYFDDIRGCFNRGPLVFSHFPVHPKSLSGPYRGNVHGHLHCHLVYLDNGEVDRRYFNACVERHDFSPVPFDDIKDYFGL